MEHQTESKQESEEEELHFQKLKLADKEKIEAYFQKGQYENSECTFTNLYIWRDCYDVQWTETEGYLVIQPGLCGECWILPPYGDYANGALPQVIKHLADYYHRNGKPLVIRAVTEAIRVELEKQCGGWFSYEEERDIEDYCYDADDLRTLKGRRYHGKRNHLSNFEKQYPDYIYESLQKAAIPEVWQCLQEWCDQKAMQGKLTQDLLCEREAIREALEQFDVLSYRGGLIRIDGKVQAFTLGERLNHETIVIHIEKANAAMQGLYAAINRDFLLREWPDAIYVNREEDTGDVGLRKAKESYYPIKLVTKYKATYLPESEREQNA